MSREIVCQSCDQQKASLQRVKSVLIKGIELTMCKTCVDSKYEPRYIVILAIRQYGVTDIARKFITEERYLGELIAASDIV